MKKRMLFVDSESDIFHGLRRRLSLLLCAVIFLPLATATYAEDKIYKVGIVPQFEARRLHQIWRPIFNELEQRTGLRFEIQGSPTINAFEREFMSGTFDFAYMNPYHILLASEMEGYIPLTRDVGRTLHGVLVVHKDSDIRTVEDLNKKQVAFPSPNALGASLQMRQELADKFHIQVKPRYVRTHDSVYLNVALRQASAGGGVQKTLSHQPEDIRSMLKVIHSTTPVPPHPLAAHPRVPAEVRDTVRQALLAIGDTEAGRQLLAEIPVRQIGVASITDYAPLKEMGLDRFYVNQE
jgi:phosphonate transport system substrate-binding protein